MRCSKIFVVSRLSCFHNHWKSKLELKIEFDSSLCPGFNPNIWSYYWQMATLKDHQTSIFYPKPCSLSQRKDQTWDLSLETLNAISLFSFCDLRICYSSPLWLFCVCLGENEPFLSDSKYTRQRSGCWCSRLQECFFGFIYQRKPFGSFET